LLDIPKPQLPNPEAFSQAKPIVFFLLEDQQNILKRALKQAADNIEKDIPNPKKLAAAITHIAEKYSEYHSCRQ